MVLAFTVVTIQSCSKENLKNKHIQTEQWECSGVIKVCEAQPCTKEKLIGCTRTMQKTSKEIITSPLQNYSYSTQNTFGLSQIYVHRLLFLQKWLFLF